MVNRFVYDTAGLPIEEQAAEMINSAPAICSIEEAQEIIYSFFIDIVKQWTPEAVLQEFRHIFIQDNDSLSSNPVRAIYEIVFANKPEEFHYTIKRVCYIVVNNWVAKRNNNYIQKLIEILNEPIIRRRSLSPMIYRLRKWIQTFLESKDYQELELYAQTKVQDRSRLSNRATSILLSSQYNNPTNPIEQRLAAKNRALQLKCRFKFDLAMYMTRFESATTTNSLCQNPTEVGDEVLRIIKIIVAKRDTSSYLNLADKFTGEVRRKNYQQFKQSLQSYLMCTGENQKLVDSLSVNLSQKLNSLYAVHNDKVLTDQLLLKTCNKLIEYLTTENRRQPSKLLITLINEGHPLTAVVLLLKIVLICKPARIHLESCIADSIGYYDKFPEESIWMKNFIEIFNIMFAIYADNMLI